MWNNYYRHDSRDSLSLSSYCCGSTLNWSSTCCCCCYTHLTFWRSLYHHHHHQQPSHDDGWWCLLLLLLLLAACWPGPVCSVNYCIILAITNTLRANAIKTNHFRKSERGRWWLSFLEYMARACRKRGMLVQTNWKVNYWHADERRRKKELWLILQTREFGVLLQIFSFKLLSQDYLSLNLYVQGRFQF